ncbi:MAG: peroxiredoxin [Synechococcus sp. TMED19]|nr:MAG: peroxiredoxin [Synechococcus sp. TMED19]OUT72035.1 MAG: peroxiredoxin [Synechococcus sp. TMED19]
MKRSELLRLMVGTLLVAGSQLLPKKAHALGGTLPDLDTQAPDFDLEAAGQDGALGQRLSLDSFRGSWLVLYFYPRDFTSGCTLEAQGFQRDLDAFKSINAAVVGVSADGSEKHASFCSSEGLAYPLLSDPGGSVSKRYGSWIPPFSQRHTFIVDPDGILRARFVGVNPGPHSSECLSTLKELQQL